MELTPYIIFNGDCERALKFYEKAFRGEIKSLMRFEGTPGEAGVTDKNKVMHAVFQAKGITLMASDGGQPAGPNIQGGMIHLSLNFDNSGEQENVFSVLADGGTVTMALQDTFWGARFGMLTDQFGINWMFNYEKKNAGRR